MSSKPKFASERIESAAGYIIGTHYARCKWEQENGDDLSLRRECSKWWWSAEKLSSLSCGLTDYKSDSAVHFSIASMNECRKVADIIEHFTGDRPEPGKDFY